MSLNILKLVFIQILLMLLSISAIDIDCKSNPCKLVDIKIEDSNEIAKSDVNTAITQLVIEDGTLKFLPMKILDCFPNLQLYTVSNCELENIQKDSISKLIGLVEIDFSQNELSKIDADTFAENKKLKKLSLKSNFIETVHCDAFKNLSLLTYLDLSANKISKIDAKQFSMNSELKELNMMENNIKSIEITQFYELYKLEFVNFYKNEIEILPSRLFIDSENLKKFNISNNKLKYIASNNFEEAHKIEFDLQNNECLKDKLSKNDNIKEIVKQKCSPPEEMNRKWIDEEFSETIKLRTKIRNIQIQLMRLKEDFQRFSQNKASITAQPQLNPLNTGNDEKSKQNEEKVQQKTENADEKVKTENAGENLKTENAENAEAVSNDNYSKIEKKNEESGTKKFVANIENND